MWESYHSSCECEYGSVHEGEIISWVKAVPKSGQGISENCGIFVHSLVHNHAQPPIGPYVPSFYAFPKIQAKL